MPERINKDGSYRWQSVSQEGTLVDGDREWTGGFPFQAAGSTEPTGLDGKASGSTWDDGGGQAGHHPKRDKRDTPKVCVPFVPSQWEVAASRLSRLSRYVPFVPSPSCWFLEKTPGGPRFVPDPSQTSAKPVAGLPDNR